MSLPIELEDILCKPIAPRLPDLCAIFPGGAEICLFIAGQPPSLYEMALAALAQASAALAPLAPVFTIIEVILAIKQCIDAIPDALKGDVGALDDCAENLTKQIQALLRLIPQLSIPILIGTLLDYIIAMIQGTIDEIKAIIRLLVKLTRARLVPSAGLLELILCSEASVATGLDNLFKAFGAVNSVIELLNVFGEPLGIEIPTLDGALGDDPEQIVEPLEFIVEGLITIRGLLPGDPFWPLDIAVGATLDTVSSTIPVA